MRSRNWTTNQFVFLSLLLINRCCFVTALAEVLFLPPNRGTTVCGRHLLRGYYTIK